MTLRRSELPANNPTRLIDELKRQLDKPEVHEFLRLHGHERVDVVFRIARRQAVVGPQLTLTKLARAE